MTTSPGAAGWPASLRRQARTAGGSCRRSPQAKFSVTQRLLEYESSGLPSSGRPTFFDTFETQEVRILVVRRPTPGPESGRHTDTVIGVLHADGVHLDAKQPDETLSLFGCVSTGGDQPTRSADVALVAAMRDGLFVGQSTCPARCRGSSRRADSLRLRARPSLQDWAGLLDLPDACSVTPVQNCIAPIMWSAPPPDYRERLGARIGRVFRRQAPEGNDTQRLETAERRLGRVHVEHGIHGGHQRAVIVIAQRRYRPMDRTSRSETCSLRTENREG